MSDDNRWVIDANIDTPAGVFCFCPVRGDLDGDFKVIVGLNMISSEVPRDGRLVGVVHSDGQVAVETFCERRRAELNVLVPDWFII